MVLCIHPVFLDAKQLAQKPAKQLGAFHDHDFHTPLPPLFFASGEPRQHQYSGNHDQDQLYRKQGGYQQSCSKSSRTASGAALATAFQPIIASVSAYRCVVLYHSQHIPKRRRWCQSFEQTTSKRPEVKETSAGSSGTNSLLIPSGKFEVRVPFSSV